MHSLLSGLGVLRDRHKGKVGSREGAGEQDDILPQAGLTLRFSSSTSESQVHPHARTWLWDQLMREAADGASLEPVRGAGMGAREAGGMGGRVAQSHRTPSSGLSLPSMRRV